MDTNVTGYANCIRHAAAAMKANPGLTLRRVYNDQGEGTTDLVAGSKGTIVNVASISSFIEQLPLTASVPRIHHLITHIMVNHLHQLADNDAAVCHYREHMPWEYN